MTVAERFVLIGCLLQGALSREWAIWMPQSIEALSGSCVLIPCRFDIPSQYDQYLVAGPKGQWKKGNTGGTVVFDSKSTSNLIQGKITGDLQKKNCTTILEKFPLSYNDKYFFRLVAQNPLKGNFRQGVQINIKDSPPKPKLTPVKVEVTEGSSVNLSCSAAAPCPTLPPTLTWTPRLSDSEDQLQENQDQTKSVSSVLTFTASHLHHGQKITCTALYKVQQGDTQKTSEASLTLSVLYSPKNTSVSVSPSGPVLEGSSVTLACSSNANPPVQNYTWYKVNGSHVTRPRAGRKLVLQVSDRARAQFYCMAANDHGHDQSRLVQLDVHYSPENTSVSFSPSGSVLEGSSVTLTCSSNANPPVQSYTWYKGNGKEMNTVGTGAKSVQVRDSGYYYCEAQNQRGTQRSEKMFLFIGGSQSSLLYMICGALVLLNILTVGVAVHKYKSLSKQIKAQQGPVDGDTYNSLQMSTVSPSDYEVIRINNGIEAGIS